MASKKDQSIRYFEQFYQIWDEYFWMTPEKGQTIVPAPICWEQRDMCCVYKMIISGISGIF